MDADALLTRLQSVQPAGPGQWNARCPAHEDREASLSVGAQTDRVLLHCHAGCGLGKIMHALGLSWRDIFHDQPEPGPIRVPSVERIQHAIDMAPTSRADEVDPLPEASVLEHFEAQLDQTVADRLLEVKGWSLGTLRAFGVGWTGERLTIPVRDGEGNLLTVLGYVPGGKPKMKALKGRGRHLFPAMEIVPKSIGVWLVEGETDAITAHELAIPAVGAPGVNTWRDEWDERFRGRRVTVCFDCDEQGRTAAAERVDGFRRAGVEARSVDLDPSRSDGFDLSDALVGAVREGRVEDLRKYLARLWYEAWAA